MLIDTHIHLDAPEFDADCEAVLARAREAGVRGFVVPGVSAATFRKVTDLGERHADVHCAYGIHPLYLSDAKEEDLGALEACLASERAVAVGEIGLDFFVSDEDVARQEFFLTEQLKLARKYDLPVILHVRRAQDAVLKYLRRFPVCGGVAHAFNGSRQQAEAFIALGLKLGFGGAMTFEGSTRIRALAASLPLETLVLETDAPDISPAWGQGRRNEPENLARYAQVLAQLRGMREEDVIEATGRNAQAVFFRRVPHIGT